MRTRSKTATIRRRCRDDRQGAAIVEFALVANVLLLTIFTCVEFGRINLIRNTAQNAAYYAARAAMVSGATAQDAEDTANQLMGSIGTQGVTVTVNDGTALSASTEQVEVKVTVNYHDNAFFAPLFIPNKDFVATAKMKAERYSFFYDGSN